MRIPKRIKVGKTAWTIHLVKGYYEKTGNLGMCNRWKKTITIDADQSRKDQEITLIHEILHAIWPEGVVGHTTEEKLVEGMDGILHQVLTTNKLE